MLKYTELTLIVSKSSPVFSWMVSCPSLLTALVFLLLHTLQKKPTLLHSMHLLLYAGHCLGGCVLPHIYMLAVMECYVVLAFLGCLSVLVLTLLFC